MLPQSSLSSTDIQKLHQGGQKIFKGIQKTAWPVPFFLKNPRINQKKDEERTSAESCQSTAGLGCPISTPGNRGSVSCADLTTENDREGQGHAGGLLAAELVVAKVSELV